MKISLKVSNSFCAKKKEKRKTEVRKIRTNREAKSCFFFLLRSCCFIEKKKRKKEDDEMKRKKKKYEYLSLLQLIVIIIIILLLIDYYRSDNLSVYRLSFSNVLYPVHNDVNVYQRLTYDRTSTCNFRNDEWVDWWMGVFPLFFFFCLFS